MITIILSILFMCFGLGFLDLLLLVVAAIIVEGCKVVFPPSQGN